MRRLLVLFVVVLFPFYAHAAEKAPKAPAPAGKFQLTSTAFEANSDIPQKYTCQGSDTNPLLKFQNTPAKAKSLAITVHDPDAPEGVWVHWVVYNIPPNTTELPENINPEYQALNDFGKYNYAGPCPSDEKQHHYIFRAYALDVILMTNDGMTMKDLEKAMRGHIVAQSELVGVYRKPIW